MSAHGIGTALTIVAAAIWLCPPRFGWAQPSEGGAPSAARDKTRSVDRLYLHTGRIVEGWILSEDAFSVRFRIIVGTIESEVTYPKNEIEQIERDVALMRERNEAEPGQAHKPAAPTDARQPVTAPAAEAAPVFEFPAAAIPSEQLAIMAALSGEYTIRGHRIEKSPRVEDIAPFMLTKDASVREVTGFALGVYGLYEILNLKTDLTPEGILFYADVLDYAISSVNSPIEDALSETVRIINNPSGSIGRAADKLRERERLSVDIQATQNQLRRAVKTMFASSYYPALPMDAIDVRFEPRSSSSKDVLPTSPAAIIIGNRTGVQLDNTVVIVDVTVDSNAIDKIHAGNVAKLNRARDMEAALGVSGDLYDDRLAMLEHERDRMKLGSGMGVLIEKFAPSTQARIEFAPVGDVYQIIDSIRVTVVVDKAGETSTQLDMEKARAQIQRHIDTQQARTKRSR